VRLQLSSKTPSLIKEIQMLRQPCRSYRKVIGTTAITVLWTWSFFGFADSGLSVTATTRRVAITNTWLREPIGNQKATALYGHIENTSKRPLVIVGIQIEVANHSELHETQIDPRGVASMLPQKRIVLKPGAKLELSPGGFHGMAMGLTTSIKKGEKIRGKFLIENEPPQDFEAIVR
jgi:copper(I)-binding protein